MEEFYLPNEILGIVFSFINDTKTYLSSRVVCKNWYDHLKIGKIFYNNKISETVYFLDNYIKDTPEDNRAPVLVYSGKDLTDKSNDETKVQKSAKSQVEIN